MRRSAVSIAANITEGSSRSSLNDFARFVEIAYGSLMETVSHAAVARSEEYLSDADYRDLYDRTEKLGRMLTGLKKTLKLQ